MEDMYDLKRTEEVAKNMLKRYSTAKVAWEMAGNHAADYKMGTRESNYWQAVANRILILTNHVGI